jgi:hypothetical protein
MDVRTQARGLRPISATHPCHLSPTLPAQLCRKSYKSPTKTKSNSDTHNTTTAIMLYLVGLGLADEKDVTVRGLEIIKKAERVYLESYTAVLLVDKEVLVRRPHVL